jgi:hypothetical protein
MDLENEPSMLFIDSSYRYLALASSLGRNGAIGTLRDELSSNVWGPREIVKFALVRELPP